MEDKVVCETGGNFSVSPRFQLHFDTKITTMKNYSTPAYITDTTGGDHINLV